MIGEKLKNGNFERLKKKVRFCSVDNQVRHTKDDTGKRVAVACLPAKLFLTGLLLFGLRFVLSKAVETRFYALSLERMAWLHC